MQRGESTKMEMYLYNAFCVSNANVMSFCLLSQFLYSCQNFDISNISSLPIQISYLLYI
jgi:hypothetical protein